jgi:hypothetical protein
MCLKLLTFAVITYRGTKNKKNMNNDKFNSALYPALVMFVVSYNALLHCKQHSSMSCFLLTTPRNNKLVTLQSNWMMEPCGHNYHWVCRIYCEWLATVFWRTQCTWSYLYTDSSAHTSSLLTAYFRQRHKPSKILEVYSHSTLLMTITSSRAMQDSANSPRNYNLAWC